jgi:hypothetical protein
MDCIDMKKLNFAAALLRTFFFHQQDISNHLVHQAHRSAHFVGFHLHQILLRLFFQKLIM